MADYLTLNDIKPLLNIPKLIGDIEEGFIAKERILELGQVIEDPSLARRNDDQITIVDLTGVAIQDIQIAKMVYRAYLEKVT